MGPLLMNASQVTGMNSSGEYLKDEDQVGENINFTCLKFKTND